MEQYNPTVSQRTPPSDKARWRAPSAADVGHLWGCEVRSKIRRDTLWRSDRLARRSGTKVLCAALHAAATMGPPVGVSLNSSEYFRDASVSTTGGEARTKSSTRIPSASIIGVATNGRGDRATPFRVNDKYFRGNCELSPSTGTKLFMLTRPVPRSSSPCCGLRNEPGGKAEDEDAIV